MKANGLKLDGSARVSIGSPINMHLNNYVVKLTNKKKAV